MTYICLRLFTHMFDVCVLRVRCVFFVVVAGPSLELHRNRTAKSVEYGV